MSAADSDQAARYQQTIARLEDEIEALRDDQTFYANSHDQALNGFRLKSEGGREWCCNAHAYKHERNEARAEVARLQNELARLRGLVPTTRRAT